MAELPPFCCPIPNGFSPYNWPCGTPPYPPFRWHLTGHCQWTTRHLTSIMMVVGSSEPPPPSANAEHTACPRECALATAAARVITATHRQQPAHMRGRRSSAAAGHCKPGIATSHCAWWHMRSQWQLGKAKECTHYLLAGAWVYPALCYHLPPVLSYPC